MTTRKHAFYSILALISLLGLGITQSVRASLITNGGFETGNFTGWNLSSHGFIGFVTGPVGGIAPHSGNFQAALVFGLLGQTPPTTPGLLYTIDFWLAHVGQSFNDAFIVNWGLGPILTLSGQDEFGYTEYTFNLFAPKGNPGLSFGFLGLGSTWLLDDVSVTPTRAVPDGGSTVSLLGFGLLGLAALRRRLGC